MRDMATSDHPAIQRELDRLEALSLPQGRFGLETIREILARLGHPERSLPSTFHVAGTNGKGSTCAYLRTMLEAQGLSVHVATKPHLVRYNERIRLAGKLIDDDLLAELLKEVLDLSEDLHPSFFEVTTAATFLAFSRIPADACVIEVGLGGRFDATNVMERPAACGIASLGIDHEAFLLREEEGVPQDPLARIAFEKAGIVRKGVPLVTQSYPERALVEVERIARERGAPHFLRGRDWDVSATDQLHYRDAKGELTLPLPRLHGQHQADNAGLAVALLRHQDEVHVSPEAMAEGISNTEWPARLQTLKPGPLTALLPDAEFILDGGHNPDAAQALAHTFGDRPRLNLVMAMMKNRPVREFLAPIAAKVERLYAVPIPGWHEDHDPKDICRVAQELGIVPTEPADDVPQALERLKARIESEGDARKQTVLICGSLYLAGVVLKANDEVVD
ncbi:MAG TPA: folylpolyglutamate synthase/dihydrofolate synthase family protein [Sphingomonadaceae bacterium]|nr:folylpolyglutamate synthase/dihydrofolate synthase family protein [Sphingomonadaceae bacterium]